MPYAPDEVPTLPFRIALFLSSYAPLLLLMAYQNRDSASTWRPLVVVSVVSSLALVVVMWTKRSEQGPRLIVRQSRPKDGDVLAYTATYLVPFLDIDLAKRDQAVVFCGFLLVLGIVYINSNMLFVNPLLSLARYHTFEVVDQDGHEYSVLTKRSHFDPGETIRPAQVSRYIRLEVRK